MQILVIKLGLKLNLCGTSPHLHALYYACVSKEAGAPLHDCVSIIDSTKISMHMPGVINTHLQSCSSEDKRKIYLIY